MKAVAIGVSVHSRIKDEKTAAFAGVIVLAVAQSETSGFRRIN